MARERVVLEDQRTDAEGRTYSVKVFENPEGLRWATVSQQWISRSGRKQSSQIHIDLASLPVLDDMIRAAAEQL